MPTDPPIQNLSILKGDVRPAPLEAESVWHRVVAQASASPECPAILTAEETVCYRDLVGRCDRIAAALKARGVGHRDVVGLLTDRTPDMVATVLAISRVGGVLLPLDPSFPADRLTFMVRDAGAGCILHDRSGADHPILGEGVPGVDITRLEKEGAALPPLEDKTMSADASAYILYTSGSTGQPKGVIGHHLALANFLSSMADRPGMGPDDRLLSVTTLSFDIAMLELFLPLWVGGTIVLPNAVEARDPRTLMGLMETHGVTIMQGTPATWRLLLEAGWPGQSDLKALCGGEHLSASLAETLLPKVQTLWNLYGPTETTIWSSCGQITDAENVQVGKPIANTQLYVVDEDDALCPRGEVGGLWIGGAGGTTGYWQREALTADRFRLDPFTHDVGARVYRTGDLARITDDGTLIIMGRNDSQVKIRGFRVELGEVEAAIERHPALLQSVVLYGGEDDGDATLSAYIRWRNEGEASHSAHLRHWLKDILPDYMVPQRITDVSVFPLTLNGKVDRRALATRGSMPQPSRSGEDDLPHTPLQMAIADIWQDILKINRIRITDTFFDLGGQSLQLALMVARVRDEVGCDIDPRAAIYETLEQLARPHP